MFSTELLDKLQAEAALLGLKGATAISLAVRADLSGRKREGKVPDERTQTYYVAGRVVDCGVAFPAPSTGTAFGLQRLSALAGDLATWHFDFPEGALGDCMGEQIKAARVNLARKGEAHLQTPVGYVEKDGPPTQWIDVWVFNDEAACEAHAAGLKAGKIF